MRDWKYLKYDIEERWDNIKEIFCSPREWVNKQNPKFILYTFALCALIFILTGLSQIFGGSEKSGPAGSSKAWFYDLNTGELFTAAAKELPPIKAPSGPLPDGQPAGVLAHVFSFADEPNELNRFIAFLETYTPDMKEQMSAFLKSKNKNPDLLKDWNSGRLVRAVDGNDWYPADSKQGREIQKIPVPDANCRQPNICMPD